MIHTILPPEALLPLQELPESEWLPCPEGWVQVMTDADGLRTVQGICSTRPKLPTVNNALLGHLHSHIKRRKPTS